jgi:hypothetical protein
VRTSLTIIALLALSGCGSGSEASATSSASAAAVAVDEQKEIYRVKVEKVDPPANFSLKEPSESEKSLIISELEGRWRPYMGDGESVRATYRYLRSSEKILIEKIAYVSLAPAQGNRTGPIYAHYMAMKDGKLVSIMCLPFEPIASVPVASSNCAREVGAALGADYLALIRSNAVEK